MGSLSKLARARGRICSLLCRGALVERCEGMGAVICDVWDEAWGARRPACAASAQHGRRGERHSNRSGWHALQCVVTQGGGCRSWIQGGLLGGHPEVPPRRTGGGKKGSYDGAGGGGRARARTRDRRPLVLARRAAALAQQQGLQAPNVLDMSVPMPGRRRQGSWELALGFGEENCCRLLRYSTAVQRCGGALRSSAALPPHPLAHLLTVAARGQAREAACSSHAGTSAPRLCTPLPQPALPLLGKAEQDPGCAGAPREGEAAAKRREASGEADRRRGLNPSSSAARRIHPLSQTSASLPAAKGSGAGAACGMAGPKGTGRRTL